jgi:ABC-type multidrug transport system ATPase subunit
MKKINTLQIENLNKSYGKKSILNKFSLSCHTGEIIGIFGKNGTGKSTLLKCIFGTVRSDAVNIQINKENITPCKIITDRRIGYLPQDSFLPKEKKVRDIIPLMYPEGELQDKIFYAPNVYKIENRKAGQLSLGELRYIELLLLAHLDHQFLMLDEPFSMLQPLHKDWIKELLLSLREKKGIIITDHYYEDVLQVTDRNLLIKNGKPIKINTRKDLKDHGYLKRES